MDDQHALGWALAADCRITRRKYYFIATDATGESRFASKHLGAVLEWLWAAEIDSFDILADSGTYRVRMERVRDTKEVEQWRK